MNNDDKLKFIQEYIQSNNNERLELVKQSAISEPYLYRYRPMKDHDFDVIFNNSFWLQSLDKQNDEIEGLAFLSSTDIIKLKCTQCIPKHLKNNEILKYNNLMINELKRIRDNFGVICFSENKNNKIMWENYADNYSGICIEYNKLDFANADMHIIPVYYKEKRLVSDFFNLKVKGKTIRLKINKNFSPEISFAYKTLKWEHEKEWRHIKSIQELIHYKNDIDLLSNLELNKDSIDKKTIEIQELKNDFMKKIPISIEKGKLINGIKPNKIFIGHNMKIDNKNKIINFCKSNTILYEVI